jgi:hypothetical protein
MLLCLRVCCAPFSCLTWCARSSTQATPFPSFTLSLRTDFPTHSRAPPCSALRKPRSPFHPSTPPPSLSPPSPLPLPSLSPPFTLPLPLLAHSVCSRASLLEELRGSVLPAALPEVQAVVRRVEGPGAPLDPLGLVEDVKPAIDALAANAALRKVRRAAALPRSPT